MAAPDNRPLINSVLAENGHNFRIDERNAPAWIPEILREHNAWCEEVEGRSVEAAGTGRLPEPPYEPIEIADAKMQLAAQAAQRIVDRTEGEDRAVTYLVKNYRKTFYRREAWRIFWRALGFIALCYLWIGLVVMAMRAVCAGVMGGVPK